MDIILKSKLVNGIGINTGNKLINFLFNKNDNIPNKTIFKYVINSVNKNDHLLEFYFGNNLMVNNNILFYKINLPTNVQIIINSKLEYNHIIINIYSKIKNYQTIVTKIYQDEINTVDIDPEYIQKIKLHYDLFNCIENIKHKLLFMNLSDDIKNNIRNKLINFYNNKDNYENLQLMNKINELNKKFLLT